MIHFLLCFAAFGQKSKLWRKEKKDMEGPSPKVSLDVMQQYNARLLDGIIMRVGLEIMFKPFCNVRVLFKKCMYKYNRLEEEEKVFEPVFKIKSWI